MPIVVAASESDRRREENENCACPHLEDGGQELDLLAAACLRINLYISQVYAADWCTLDGPILVTSYLYFIAQAL